MPTQPAPRYFHGTSATLAPGDTLVPGAQIGRDTYGLGETNHVYVTTNLRMAAVYAMSSLGLSGDDFCTYEVTPVGPAEPDGINGEDFKCAAATIVREVGPDGLLYVDEDEDES